MFAIFTLTTAQPFALYSIVAFQNEMFVLGFCKIHFPKIATYIPVCHTVYIFYSLS